MIGLIKELTNARKPMKYDHKWSIKTEKKKKTMESNGIQQMR
jgi:hypothetical protein